MTTTTATTVYRALARTVPSMDTADGAGVRLRRSLGNPRGGRLDPFLMLDEFFSDNPDDYIAGFPEHPHRGFETVTYMLNGRMQHRDHLGNTGDLGPGGVQWMTAGHGVIHSEMPQQAAGRMRGFQLWINLPAAEKMKPAGYRDIPAAEIPEVEFPGGRVRVIAGVAEIADHRVTGPINPPDAPLSTDPLFVDIRLLPGAELDLPVGSERAAFVYPYDGEVTIDDEALETRSAAVLGDGDRVRLVAGGDGASVLLLAGRPIGEPVVQHGPFVMNSREEIEQALADYRSGRLVASA